MIRLLEDHRYCKIMEIVCKKTTELTAEEKQQIERRIKQERSGDGCGAMQPKHARNRKDERIEDGCGSRADRLSGGIGQRESLDDAARSLKI